MSKQNYYVTHRANGEWAAIGEGNSRASSVHSTQAEAIAAAKPLAQQNSSELRIQGRSGQFREAWSYGNDPHPPKG
jgi:hypothetical protein